MPPENHDNWYLKKHEDGDVFGPLAFDKILEWAASAQVAPQDMLSEDGVIWTKAPMVSALNMDWIVKLDEDHYYGPTTTGTLLEFLANGEIGPDTMLLDCCSGEEMPLKACAFYPAPEPEPAEDQLEARSPSKGIIRLSLQRRIRELEVNVLDKRRQLEMAAETIEKLEARIRELESRIRESSGSAA